MTVMRVGETWNGGIYAGITRSNEHLVLAFPHTLTRDVIWQDADVWAKRLGNGWRLPNRNEAALLYANLRDFFEDRWYWTSERYPPDETCMWVEAFGYGRQADARMTDACRACAVRTFTL